MGAAIAMGAMLATRVVEACSSGRAPSRVVRRGGGVVAPAIRFPLLVALHAGLYGVLVRAWSDTRVNAPFIFGAKRGTELTRHGRGARGIARRVRVVRRRHSVGGERGDFRVATG